MKCHLLILSLFLTLYASAQQPPKLDSLTRLLEQVYERDQKPREQWSAVQIKYGSNSKEAVQQWAIVIRQDSLNQKIVTSIIDQYGWLSDREISSRANQTLFYVIQHADVSLQIKYLPVIEKAIREGKASKRSYAYLKDRINMHTGKYQIYGTQVSGDYLGNPCFWPIADELNVNARRNELGMESIEKYAMNFNIHYRPPSVDSLVGKVILTVFVSDKTGKSLASVKILTGTHQLLAETNADGVCRLIMDRSIISSNLILEKKGFDNGIINFKEKEKDVIFINFIMT